MASLILPDSSERLESHRLRISITSTSTSTGCEFIRHISIAIVSYARDTVILDHDGGRNTGLVDVFWR